MSQRLMTWVCVLLICVLASGCAGNVHRNKIYPVGDEVIHSHQILAYVYETYGIDKAQYAPVKYTASLNSSQRGRWDIQLQRRDTSRPDYIFVTVDTAQKQSYNYSTAAYNTKLEQAYLLDDMVSSSQAIKTAKAALADEFGTVGTVQQLFLINVEDRGCPIWDVCFAGSNFVQLNAQTGEVLSVN